MSSLNVGELPFKFSQYAVCWPTTAMAQGMYGQLFKFVSGFRREIKAMKIINYDEIKEEVNDKHNEFYLGKEIEFHEDISFEREASDDELDLNPDFVEEVEEKEKPKPKEKSQKLTPPKNQIEEKVEETTKKVEDFFDPFKIAAKTPKVQSNMVETAVKEPTQKAEHPLKLNSEKIEDV